MKNSSLVRRLWLASAAVLPLFVGISAWTLNRIYVDSLHNSEREALLAQIYALIAVADLELDADKHQVKLALPAALANPRFETPESGLYARVLNHRGQVIWQSNSLEISELHFFRPPLGEPGQALPRHFYYNDSNWRALSFTTLWELDNQEYSFQFDVIHSQREKLAEIYNYQQHMLRWLGGMTLLLIALQIVIARWSLKPLKRLAGEIEAIESGQIQRLSERYPDEIQPVTLSLNKLISSEEQQRERYKNALGDLAHSLKTPLSVIRAQLEHNSQKDKLVDEQVQRMSSIIEHQLKRASAEVKTLFNQRCDIETISRRICAALGKVYAQQQTDFDISIEAGLSLNMQENDLLELLGNLLENACKYGRGQVKISAQRCAEQQVLLCIEDNGPGIDDSVSQAVLERGARADTGKQGQGLGLAIAIDIVSAYNGSLSIKQSGLGGACFEIRLPSAS
ncbi:ATP-binding protein [Agaribacterium haliotis]|uniref:ATP-binding protein n=1 Tax=Agaribacterium haliotis TaxID=2013869 RepID=UPI000BB54DB2|nr:ATP-binding protein [Agaribacterium haliotis]